MPGRELLRLARRIPRKTRAGRAPQSLRCGGGRRTSRARCPRGFRFRFFEGNPACEIEAVHYNALVAADRTGRFGAKTACDDAVGARASTERSDPLLFELIDCAAVFTPRREQSPLALENHSQIRR